MIIKELNKCKKDSVYFIEHYIKDINGKSIKLSDIQKKFLYFLYSLKFSDKLFYIKYR